MSNCSPENSEVEEGSPFGGGECQESSSESPEAAEAIEQEEGQEVENLCPLDNLDVQFYDEEPEDNNAGEVATEDVYDAGAMEQELNPEESYIDENAVDSAMNEDDSYASESFDQSLTEDPANANFKTYVEDFIYSNASSSFDEGSNSNLEENKDEPRGIPLGRFTKIVKALEVADYETIQILYQLLYQRSAWDTQELLTQRILEFSGFSFGKNSEDYYNREMMLCTQPDDVLVKIGVILGIDNIHRMLSNMEKNRDSLISSILFFLSRPNKKQRNVQRVEDVQNGSDSSAGGILKCGCRNRCVNRFTKKEQTRLLEYMKELESKKLLDKYVLNFIECRKIVRSHIPEDCKKLKEVAYYYKCKYGKKVITTCKTGFCNLHNIKQGKLNQLQNKLKFGQVGKLKMALEDFPPLLSESELAAMEEPKPEPKPSIVNLPDQKKPKTWVSSEEQVLKMDEELKAKIDDKNEAPKVVIEKMDVDSIKQNDSTNGEGSSTSKENEAPPKTGKLKEFPLVVKAIENASDELLIDVHFILFLESAETEKIRGNILEFEGFPFSKDTEDYDERYEFLQRMSFKIVSDVARSFCLGVSSSKEDTINNLLNFLSKPNDSFLQENAQLPLSLSDVEFDDIDDIGNMSDDSDCEVICEVVDKKEECIDLLDESGDESDKDVKAVKSTKPTVDAQKKDPKLNLVVLKTPPKTAAVANSHLANAAKLVQSITSSTAISAINTTTQSAATTAQSNTQSTGTRTLKNFETIRKIVNTHPHEYLVDIYDLLYMKKHDPATLRAEILDFGGFNFEKGTPEYVKRKQLLDRMLYNSVRRIYNTVIHNTTEVKVFSKPTMITEIFQFLFKLPDHDTSIRPLQNAKPVKPQLITQATVAASVPKITGIAVPPTGLLLPNQAGKLSDLKRVFQRVACFPCEYLTDVHKLLFMSDCDAKNIRQNIFGFKGFNFDVDSNEFKQRKMYLEYLTFHSLRKISSVLTTKSVDLRNSTKHELATHLTQVLAEYTTSGGGVDDSANEAAEQPDSSSTPGVENIVVTPLIDPSLTGPAITHVETTQVQVVSSAATSTTTPKIQSTPQTHIISIVDTRSVNSPAVTTTSKRGRKRGTSAKNKAAEQASQFADVNLPEVEQYQHIYGQNLNIYQTTLPTITGIATFGAPGIVVPQTIPVVGAYTQPLQVVQAVTPTVLTPVPQEQTEIIVPEECVTADIEAPPAKKIKIASNSSTEDKTSKTAIINEIEDEDGDKPLASLVGHPIDSVLKKKISDIVSESDLGSITMNSVIQKVFSMYPKFDLSYRKDFIKSTLRTILFKLAEPKDSNNRDTESPDCSVTTTDPSDNASRDSSEGATVESS